MSPRTTTAQLRMKAAVNLFKELILGDGHVPGRPQTTTLFNALPPARGKPAISERTWQSWFSSRMLTAKKNSAKVLDTLAIAHVRRAHAFELQPFFCELIYGGLVAGMLAGSPKKLTLALLKKRADKYVPRSPIHLLLDAIEVDTFSDGTEKLGWSEIKSVAADCVLRHLHSRWNPRRGTIFSTFPSDLKLIWRVATDEQKATIKASYARMQPNLFQSDFDSGAVPDWRKIGMQDDIPHQHIYKLLFALAADPHFLVAGRFGAWVIDLAAAMHAMHALAWTDRYKTLGSPHVTSELIFWMAFDHIFFGGDSRPIVLNDRFIKPAMGSCDTVWDPIAFEKFAEARAFYHNQLARFDVTTEEVEAITANATKVHPLIYRG